MKSRRELRRGSRRVAEDLGAEPTLVDRTADSEAVQRFLCLEESGYKAVAGLAMTNHSGEPEFFAAMCREFLSANGRLHLLALEALEVRHWRCAFGFEVVKDFSSTRPATRSVTLATDLGH